MPLKVVRLTDVGVGQFGRVLNFEPGNLPYRQKLLAIGLTPGVVFEVMRVAPLGDPIQLYVRGTAVSVRKKESDTMQVEICDAPTV